MFDHDPADLPDLDGISFDGSEVSGPEPTSTAPRWVPSDEDVPMDVLSEPHFEEDFVRSDSFAGENEPDHEGPVDTGLSVPRTLTEVNQGKLVDELCHVLASLDGMLSEDAAALLRQIRRSDPVLGVLPDKIRNDIVGVLNLLSFEADMVLDAGSFDLSSLPRERLYGSSVRGLVKRIRSISADGVAFEAPHRHFAALEEEVQRARSARSVAKYLASVARRDDTENLLKLYGRFEPPTTSRQVENQTFARTAAEWEADEMASRAGRAQVRISSGYRSVDVAMTREGEALGAWAGGELHVIAAPTGNGKSAHSRRTLVAAAEDLVNGWGLPRAKVYHAITEEEPSIVAAAAELLRGQRFHHLAENVTIAKIGASRTRLIKGLYDLVIQAEDESRDTGLPIDELLPRVVIIDYIGGIVEDGEPADTVAIEKSANLAMRGIAAWDFEMMEQFSGVSFATYAGRPVPKGMEHHRCAVIAYAQTLSKVDGRLWFEPGSYATPVGDFTVEKPDGSLGWQPVKGDFRVPQRKDVRGSGVLLNHATSLIILHRSRPENNEVRRRDDGLVHVDDDRARFILAKVRNASSMPFVPMRFDSQRDGPRGQFYDLVAEELIRRGKLSVASCHRAEGDPILPVRPARKPLAGVRY